MTVEDVIFSYTRVLDPELKSLYRSMIGFIDKVEKKDDKTVTVKTTIANFSLLKERLSIVRVVPASSSQDEMKKQPVGSGPWMYESISDNTLDLVPNKTTTAQLLLRTISSTMTSLRIQPLV